MLFALVANRAREPLSKLAATKRVAERAWVPGFDEVNDDACYRAMDWLLEVEAELGEKRRGDNKEARAALSRQGRCHTVAGNLRVKEVVIDGTMRDRFFICHNPEQAERDRFVRHQLLAQLRDAIAGSDQLPKPARAALAGELRTSPGLKRFLRTTPGGLLRVDRAAVAAEERLDGKFLLRTSDPTLSAEDVALGYKQLLEVERGWRDMKSTLDLRPVYHHLERRIRAHVLLCWLALLLIRLAETVTGDTWRNLRHELDRMHLGHFAGPAGQVLQRTETTPGPQAAILKALKVDQPKRFLAMAPSRHSSDTGGDTVPAGRLLRPQRAASVRSGNARQATPSIPSQYS